MTSWIVSSCWEYYNFSVSLLHPQVCINFSHQSSVAHRSTSFYFDAVSTFKPSSRSNINDVIKSVTTVTLFSSVSPQSLHHMCITPLNYNATTLTNLFVVAGSLLSKMWGIQEALAAQYLNVSAWSRSGLVPIKLNWFFHKNSIASYKTRHKNNFHFPKLPLS